jgi:hypothetical protein
MIAATIAPGAAVADDAPALRSARSYASSEASGGSCSAPLSGPFGTLVIDGKPLTCDTLIAQCKAQKPDDVALCMANTLGPAGLSIERCLPCWR